MPRQRPPADTQPWSGAVDRDLDAAIATLSRLRTNVDGALASAASATSALTNLSAAGNSQQAYWRSDITVPAAWLSSSQTPRVTISTPTNRLEIHYGGAIRNGSARICYSITNNIDGSLVYDRDVMVSDLSQALAITGSSSFPQSSHRMALTAVPPNTPLAVKLEVYGEPAGAVLSASALIVRPSL